MAAFDWAGLFQRVCRQLKSDSEAICSSSSAPQMQDVRTTHSTAASFCNAVKVCSIGRPPSLYSLVVFCFGPNATQGVHFVGALSAEETISALAEIPTEDHDLIRGLVSFLRWHQASDIVIQLLRGDISSAEKEYTTQLSKALLEPFDGIFQQRLTAAVDFNAKYGLSATKAVDPRSLCGKVDGRTSTYFLHFGITRDRPMEQWQNLISKIVLLPQTTGSVKSTFEIARKLFVFSLFEYEFATVSAHYAGLALESAIYNRWNLTLPQRGVVLEHKSSKNGGKLMGQMPTHQAITDVCKDKKWNETVLVEGRRFPKGLRSILNDLVNLAIISA
jgi:hypothetical protein